MKYRIPLELLPLEADGCHLLLEAHWFRKKLRLVLDTGASKTVFDKAMMQKKFPEVSLQLSEQQSAGLGTTQMESFLFDLDGLRLGKCKIKEMQAASLDLEHILASYAQMGQGPIHGILGGDVLWKLGAKIDYRKKVLLLRDDG